MSHTTRFQLLFAPLSEPVFCAWASFPPKKNFLSSGTLILWFRGFVACKSLQGTASCTLAQSSSRVSFTTSTISASCVVGMSCNMGIFIPHTHFCHSDTGKQCCGILQLPWSMHFLGVYCLMLLLPSEHLHLQMSLSPPV